MKYFKNQIKHFYIYYKVMLRRLFKKNSYIRSDEMISLIFVTFYRMYKISEPKANFFRLLEEGERNERGGIIIPFDDYLIDEDSANKIVNRVHKLFKMGDMDKRRHDFNIWLGASPKLKKIKL